MESSGYGSSVGVQARTAGLVGGRPQLGLPEAINSFDPSLKRLAMLAETLRSLADRLAGPRPAEAGVKETDHPPHHIIDHVQRKSRELEALVAECESERDRIATVLSG
jgi:hypothetical protein